jgi:hypothetical protein
MQAQGALMCVLFRTRLQATKKSNTRMATPVNCATCKCSKLGGQPVGWEVVAAITVDACSLFQLVTCNCAVNM